jgi:hypothetical protein
MPIKVCNPTNGRYCKFSLVRLRIDFDVVWLLNGSVRIPARLYKVAGLFSTLSLIRCCANCHFFFSRVLHPIIPLLRPGYECQQVIELFHFSDTSRPVRGPLSLLFSPIWSTVTFDPTRTSNSWVVAETNSKSSNQEYVLCLCCHYFIYHYKIRKFRNIHCGLLWFCLV